MARKRNKDKRPRPGSFRGREQSRRDNYNARRHAKWRAKTRYGQELTNHDLQVIAQQIERGEARFVQNEFAGRQVYVVAHAGVRMAVLYQPSNGEVVSVLPSDHYALRNRGVSLVDPRLSALAGLRDQFE